jgi:aminomethyltransferase
MANLKRTVLFDRHVELGAKIVEFGGWEMPVQYKTGIVQEHLTTRNAAGIFDISHMGRIIIHGKNVLDFLQHSLTNNAAALDVGLSQYTIIPNGQGGAVDDAYLYRFEENRYLLVVNAANHEKDWNHLTRIRTSFPKTEMEDHTQRLAMISLQGPKSKDILETLIESGYLPEPIRNALSIVKIAGTEVFLARTGYTGEPICFELFVKSDFAVTIWDQLLAQGASPIGLGARDTLRLEAGLPLYGHELGNDPGGAEIPIFASSLSRFAVSFSPLKGEFIGKHELEKQFVALGNILKGDDDCTDHLPRLVQPIALLDKGVARNGSRVFKDDEPVGYVTSGTMVPFWEFHGIGLDSKISDEKGMRAIGLALLDCRLKERDQVEIDIRGRRVKAMVVPYHLRSEAPPYARSILSPFAKIKSIDDPAQTDKKNVQDLLSKAIQNTRWRQHECVNLIPSEQTPSAMVRMLSVMDPACRYAEHRPLKAFNEAEVFYYQGTEFISEIEQRLKTELMRFIGCSQVETRLISGQMANTAVFSALVDYINRADRKSEPRRLQKVMNHHIIKGGHLSAQPMGALRDFVARELKTDKPAVVNFPVIPKNQYQIDIDACRKIIFEEKPELIIMGKSMTLHREPVAEVRAMVQEAGLDCIIMYDMAHVLGLIGPHFQQPFKEGADVVTGSTHKTFFGTQRGIAASDYQPEDIRYPFWEAVERRTFPGSVSNHHLGTLLGLLMAAYEMNYFKDTYQKEVIKNAKVFAQGLSDCGLDVAGDPSISYTETHQVILNVGYSKAPKIAAQLEANNIIVNYQAAPAEEGFTAAGSLRMGVSEMTRFGMVSEDFLELAQYIHDVIIGSKTIKDQVNQFRKRFLEMKYCFSDSQFTDLVQDLHRLI